MRTLLDAVLEDTELEVGQPNLEGEPWEGEVSRGSRDYVRWVQQSLNLVLGSGLSVDGIRGPKTRNATLEFQRRFALAVDGIVGPQTEAALIALSGTVPPSAASKEPPPSPKSQPSGGSCGITYSVPPGNEFGPKFHSRRPPGLPASARSTSKSGAAIPHVRRLAEATGNGAVFVDTVAGLARTESGGAFARPANIFNALPPSLRAGKKLITAWGVFQFNRDAWRALRRRLAGTTIAATSFPWEATACEEIGYPIRRYAQLFSEIRAAGGSEIEAARGIRLWHRSPSVAYAAYLRDGRSKGFGAAWSRVPSRHRLAIDSQLRKTGVLR